MNATLKPLHDLMAADIMTEDLLLLSEEMPLRTAAQALLRQQIEGAPVVDAGGKCVGVLSALDFVRLFEVRPHPEEIRHAARPKTCPFQARLGRAEGKDVVLCLLPTGSCPLQRREKNPEGKEMVRCEEPHCVLVDWQVVELENLPEIPVKNFMTADPVTASRDASIRELARDMINAHVHRVVVVDEEKRPLGIVTVTDILAAVARS